MDWTSEHSALLVLRLKMLSVKVVAVLSVILSPVSVLRFIPLSLISVYHCQVCSEAIVMFLRCSEVSSFRESCNGF